MSIRIKSILTNHQLCLQTHVSRHGKLTVMQRKFQQVDVFSTQPYFGNPVAVVIDGEGLSAEAMQHFANWTNLSETTFVLPPTRPDADYLVRIFTPDEELPFAGHPTLGTCHAWLSAGGKPRRADLIVQQCAAGLIPIRRGADGLAFAAPPLTRSGPVEESLIQRAASVLGIKRPDMLDAEWVANGPQWVGVWLASAEAVLSLKPGFVDFKLGVAGPYPPGSPSAIEVRAFLPFNGVTIEDPVTGSLNASLASWLLRTQRVTSPYIASQGTALGRKGRVQITQDADSTIWVGGGTITCIAGQVEL
jgi:PhzF family phenazine biosynthesis protein